MLTAFAVTHAQAHPARGQKCQVICVATLLAPPVPAPPSLAHPPISPPWQLFTHAPLCVPVYPCDILWSSPYTAEAVSILPWHSAYSLQQVVPHTDGLTPSLDETRQA